ncbi:MAG TPA: tRNA lysidine(34) synthetase TilS [Steroidobacteraceae bacterium]|nr:tRNA lysidine(34) synthetase TilS [Steroidobacteraceae bacterium]
MTRRAAPRAGAPVSKNAFSSMALAQSLRQIAGPLAGSRLCIAFSGGLDSTALLAACAALRGRYRCQVRAVHVNHHLQPSARAMAAAARAGARRLGIACTVIEAPVAIARGDSIEAAARAARYAALRGALRDGEWLLLAQHQDDQVETLLLQLLRGAGIAGLAAMPCRTGSLLRPLLSVTRAQLLEYVRRRSIPWSEDPSNADERFGRNYLRRRVLPVLLERWPGLGVAFARSAALAAEAQRLLGERAAAQLRHAHDGAALSVSALRRLSDPERRNGLRYWLEMRGLTMPDQRRLHEIAGPLLHARHDAQPFVQWAGGLVRRHGDLLHAELSKRTEQRSDAPQAKRLIWDWRRAPHLALPGGGRLEMRDDPRGAWLRSALPARLSVAFRRADGTVAGLPGGRRVKRALRSGVLPPWRREAVPLVYAGRRLLAVGDWWRDPKWARSTSKRKAKRCRLHWHPEGAA